MRSWQWISWNSSLNAVYSNISLRGENEIFIEGGHPKAQAVVLVFLSSSFMSGSLLVSPPFTTPILLHLRRCADSAFLFLAWNWHDGHGMYEGLVSRRRELQILSSRESLKFLMHFDDSINSSFIFSNAHHSAYIDLRWELWKKVAELDDRRNGRQVCSTPFCGRSQNHIWHRRWSFLGRTDQENVMVNELKNTNGTGGAQQSCHLCFSIGGWEILLNPLRFCYHLCSQFRLIPRPSPTA